MIDLNLIQKEAASMTTDEKEKLARELAAAALGISDVALLTRGVPFPMLRLKEAGKGDRTTLSPEVSPDKVIASILTYVTMTGLPPEQALASLFAMAKQRLAAHGLKDSDPTDAEAALLTKVGMSREQAEMGFTAKNREDWLSQKGGAA